MKRTPKDIRDYTDWNREDFAEDLRTNPRYQAFYEGYNPESIPLFIQSYSWTKHRLHENKSVTYSNADFRESEFLSEAEAFLAVILQKKLFNVQCMWRAQMIDLPHIEYDCDFEYFKENIWDCPFIEPITEAELEVGIRFLLEEDDTTNIDFNWWQDYEGFKLWDDDDDDDTEGDIANPKSMYYGGETEIPDFYIYYDNHLKTGHLFNLPDIYWEKKKYYLDAVRAENARLNALKPEGETPKFVHIPSLYSGGNDEEKFIMACEDELTKELFRMNNDEVSLSDDEELTDALEFLFKCRSEGEVIAFEEAEDWYDSVMMTVEKVKKQKIAEMMPYAYQTYMLEFEDEDIPTLMAERMARFKFDESDVERNWPRELWQRTLAQAKALLGEA